VKRGVTGASHGASPGAGIGLHRFVSFQIYIGVKRNGTGVTAQNGSSAGM